MKKFAFALEPVLEVKRRREEALLEELAKKARAAASAQAALEALRSERHRAQGELRRLLEGKVEVDQVLQGQGYLAGLNVRTETQKRVVRRRQDEVGACRQQVVAAAQERKTLEKLRTRQWEAYLAESRREEQAFLDELATQEYSRQDKAEG